MAPAGDPTRQKFDEARRLSQEVADEIEQHLRETNPRPDRPATTAQAAEELARRLHDTADKQARSGRSRAKWSPTSAFFPSAPAPCTAPKHWPRHSRTCAIPARREDARAHLEGALVESRATMSRLDEKLNGRLPADDLAAELADDERLVAAEMEAGKPGAPEPAAVVLAVPKNNTASLTPSRT